MKFVLQDLYRDKLLSAPSIFTAGKLYKELYNVQYFLTKEMIDQLLLLKDEIKCANEFDEQERNNILKWFKDTKVFDDKFTRQAVLQPKYAENENLAACLSLIQVILRPSIDIHIHVRSQHFDRNFMYDNITYALLMKQMTEKLKTASNKIFVKIISLHKEVK